MNAKLQWKALQVLNSCLSLPGWLAVALLRSQTPARPRSWEVRIRRQPPPPPAEKPRLRPRFSA